MSQVRYLFDEDCNARILRGVRRRAPALHVAMAQEAGLGSGTDLARIIHEVSATSADTRL
jgi:hypothetical protein